jgi:pyruvate/2-oxoacid:ferredoxin oxidoreductase beta subunit
MDKARNFQEKAVGVLIDLENTNVLGRLLSHFDELRDLLKDKPTVFTALCNALKTFKGPVTKSAITPCPNHWQHNPATSAYTYALATASSSSSLSSSSSPLKEVEDNSRDAADQAEDKIMVQLNKAKKWSSIP